MSKEASECMVPHSLQSWSATTHLLHLRPPQPQRVGENEVLSTLKIGSREKDWIKKGK